MGAPKGGSPEGWEPRRVEAPKGGGAKGAVPKISRIFSLSRHNVLSFFLSSLSWRSFRGISGVFEAPRPWNAHVWSSQAVVWRPKGPGFQKTPPKFNEGTPKRVKKERKLRREREKTRHFGRSGGGRSGRGRSCGGGLGEHPNLGRTHENLEHTPHTTHLTQPTTPQHHNTTQHNTRKSTIWANWLKSNWPKSSKKKYGHTKIGLSRIGLSRTGLSRASS